MKRDNLLGIWGGIALVGLGVLFLLGQLLRVNIWGYIWPFFIIGVGLAFFAGMLAGGRDLGALAVPGAVITTTGLILLFQNLFDIWATWTYAWALIIAGTGVGLFMFGSRSELPALQRAGRVVITVGLALFLLFGIIFELIFALVGERSQGGVFWAVILILAGLYMLVGRSIFARWTGPIERSLVDFGPAGDGAVSGEGVPFTQGSQLAGVRRVLYKGIGDLTINQGQPEGLVVEAVQAIRERIRTEVHGDALVIRYDYDWFDWLNPAYWNIGPIRYTLTLSALESLDASGFGNIFLTGLTTPVLKVNHSGAGNVTIRRLGAEELTVRQSGFGNVEVDGKVDRQSVDLTGAGSYQARHLESCTAEVRLSGLGSAEVRASEDLDATVSGAGSIDYIGSPHVRQKVSGLGSVRQKSA